MVSAVNSEWDMDRLQMTTKRFGFCLNNKFYSRNIVIDRLGHWFRNVETTTSRIVAEMGINAGQLEEFKTTETLENESFQASAKGSMIR
jgi:hypothetical protein